MAASRMTHHSYVSRIAERVESRQLEMAEDLLDDVGEVLGRGHLPAVEWHNLVMAMSVALHDVLRVACSRGDRLSRAGADGHGADTVAAPSDGSTRSLHQEQEAVTWAREKSGTPLARHLPPASRAGFHVLIPAARE